MQLRRDIWKVAVGVLALSLAAPLASWAVSGRNLSKSDSRAAVTVTVTYLNPLGKVKGDTLDFEVRMNTHSVHLDGFAVEKLAVLRGTNGAEVRPLGWFEPMGGGHHRSGVLRFPAKDASGKALLAGGSGVLELRIRGIADPAERVFRWQTQ